MSVLKHPVNNACWTSITLHEVGRSWPHCQTYIFILENLFVPVIISERHVVEVLNQTLLQAYKAGWDWCNPQGGGQSWGEENLPLVSRQNWGTEYVTRQLCFLTPLLFPFPLLEKWCYAQKGSRFSLCCKQRTDWSPWLYFRETLFN